MASLIQIDECAVIGQLDVKWPRRQAVRRDHLVRDSEGYISLPDATGLGIQINASTARKYLVDIEIKAKETQLFSTSDRFPRSHFSLRTSLDYLRHDIGIGVFARAGNHELMRIYIGFGTGEPARLHLRVPVLF